MSCQSPSELRQAVLRDDTLPQTESVVVVMRWFCVLLLAAALCVGCSSTVDYTSSPSSPISTPEDLNPPTTSAPATGPIPGGQCTTDDGLVATEFQAWQQTGYEVPSMASGLFADYVMVAVGGDSHEPGAVDELDAQTLQADLQAFDEEVPNYGTTPLSPSYEPSPTPGPSYGQDLAAVEADAAWWAACS